VSLGLAGRVAVVTGGTRGLGLAVARKLHASGCHVYVNYAHDDEAAEKAVAELSGGTVTALKGDVADPDVVAGLLADVAGRHGRLDILVHCAVSFHPTPTGAPALDAVHADLAVAVNPLLAAAAPLASLMTGGTGRVVVVSSIGARRVVPAYASLGVAKAALESLVRYLAAELAGKGIAVNAVSTSKMDEGRDDPAGRALAARTPAGRLTRPADVADAVALLCADEAAWIHGQVVTVDGGLTIRA